MHHIRRPVLLGLGLALALSGCGSDGGSDAPTDPSADPGASSSPAAPASSSAAPDIPADAPSCSDTWVVGAKLPRAYRGCVGDDEYLARDVLECSSGQRLVRYDESYYAVLGGTIIAAQKSPLRKDADYRRVIVACRA